MGRPPGYQWQPLGVDADPVPGDPQAISAEAAHLASVATTITGQIAALRKIASDNAEVSRGNALSRHDSGADESSGENVSYAPI